MKRILNLALAVLLFTGAAVPAFADESSPLEWSGNVEYRIDSKHYWRSIPVDGLNLVTAPARWDEGDWVKAGFVVGGTVLLYASDDQLMTWVQTNRSQTTNNVADLFTPFGNEMYVLPGLALFYGYGYMTDDNRIRKTSLLGFESWFYSSLVTTVLKRSFHRNRPNEGGGYNQWGGPSLSSDHLSFPSGHASTAWSVATVIATEYDDTWCVPAAAYTAATMVSLARINDADHWTSDVFFSSATGFFIGKALTTWHKDDSYGRLTLLPYYDGQTAALYIDWMF